MVSPCCILCWKVFVPSCSPFSSPFSFFSLLSSVRFPSLFLPPFPPTLEFDTCVRATVSGQARQGRCEAHPRRPLVPSPVIAESPLLSSLPLSLKPLWIISFNPKGGCQSVVCSILDKRSWCCCSCRWIVCLCPALLLLLLTGISSHCSVLLVIIYGMFLRLLPSRRSISQSYPGIVIPYKSFSSIPAASRLDYPPFYVVDVLWMFCQANIDLGPLQLWVSATRKLSAIWHCCSFPAADNKLWISCSITKIFQTHALQDCTTFARTSSRYHQEIAERAASGLTETSADRRFGTPKDHFTSGYDRIPGRDDMIYYSVL